MTERRQTNTLETLVRQATQGVYEVDGVIGQGGMATVYRAVPLGDVPTGRDAASDDAVALKVLLPQFAGDPEYARRFEREARAAAGLDHPSVVRVLDVGEVGGMPYMAMELLEGPDLHRLLSARREAGHGPLPATTAARLLAPVAAALDHAHGRGLVHRDVKSSNVIVVGASVLDDELSGARAVLTDFGIAHAAGGTRLTQTGTALGTAAYMAPEQARATGVDGRSDVWSLGVVLYEAVTGRLPFGGESGTGTNPMATVYRVLHEAAVPVGEAAESAGVGALPEWYRAVVGRCLRKNPDERFQSADELAQALEAGAVGDVATCIAIAGPAERGESAHGTPGEQESSGETEIWQAEVQASDTKDAPGSSIAKKKYAPMMSEHRRREERRRTWTRRALFAVGGVLILGLIYGVGAYSEGWGERGAKEDSTYSNDAAQRNIGSASGSSRDADPAETTINNAASSPTIYSANQVSLEWERSRGDSPTVSTSTTLNLDDDDERETLELSLDSDGKLNAVYIEPSDKLNERIYSAVQILDPYTGSEINFTPDALIEYRYYTDFNAINIELWQRASDGNLLVRVVEEWAAGASDAGHRICYLYISGRQLTKGGCFKGEISMDIENQGVQLITAYKRQGQFSWQSNAEATYFPIMMQWDWDEKELVDVTSVYLGAEYRSIRADLESMKEHALENKYVRDVEGIVAMISKVDEVVGTSVPSTQSNQNGTERAELPSDSEEQTSIFRRESEFVFHGCVIEIEVDFYTNMCTFSKGSIQVDVRLLVNRFDTDRSNMTWLEEIKDVRTQAGFRQLKDRVESLRIEEHRRSRSGLGHHALGNNTLGFLEKYRDKYYLSIQLYKDAEGNYLEMPNFMILEVNDGSHQREALFELARSLDYRQLYRKMQQTPSPF